MARHSLGTIAKVDSASILQATFFDFSRTTYLMISFRRWSIGLSLILACGAASADWFVSSEIKALKEKAEAGDAEAQFLVGAAYDYGRGAPKDEKEALKWYRLSADSGNIEAANSVGSILQEGKNYSEALHWYEKASAGGSAQGTNSLALLYDLGLGIPQDRKKASEIYLHAADLGWAEAMWNLANQYGAGQLGSVDMLNACIWTERAYKFARPNEKRLHAYTDRALSQMEHKLSAEDFEKCKGEAEKWAPSAQKP